VVEGAEDEVAELVAAAQRGDDSAWRALVARYLDLVWAIARGHSLDHCDAADVTQTTWMRLHEQLPRLTEPSRVGAWLATTARRESLKVARERRRQVPVLLTERYGERALSALAAPPADESIRGADSERDRMLWQAFGELTPSCQALLRALTADPPPRYSELSAALGMPIGSIGPTRARCLDRLRANLLSLSAPTGRSETGDTGGKARRTTAQTEPTEREVS
jgi:RNA polymerase sigma factor (sigma-70 family)